MGSKLLHSFCVISICFLFFSCETKEEKITKIGNLQVNEKSYTLDKALVQDWGKYQGFDESYEGHHIILGFFPRRQPSTLRMMVKWIPSAAPGMLPSLNCLPIIRRISQASHLPFLASMSPALTALVLSTPIFLLIPGRCGMGNLCRQEI